MRREERRTRERTIDEFFSGDGGNGDEEVEEERTEGEALMNKW